MAGILLWISRFLISYAFLTFNFRLSERRRLFFCWDYTCRQRRPTSLIIGVLNRILTGGRSIILSIHLETRWVPNFQFLLVRVFQSGSKISFNSKLESAIRLSFILKRFIAYIENWSWHFRQFSRSIFIFFRNFTKLCRVRGISWLSLRRHFGFAFMNAMPLAGSSHTAC